MKTSTSLVISTYNNSDILNLVLKSINIQSLLPDEIIIADCSSNYESEIIISAFTLKTKIPVIHIKQSGNKLLKAEILNKAIAKCKSEYIIQIHDDCILHKHFIKDHIHSRKYNTFLFGTIIPINQKKTDYIIKNEIYTFSFFSGKIKKKIKNIYLPGDTSSSDESLLLKMIREKKIIRNNHLEYPTPPKSKVNSDRMSQSEKITLKENSAVDIVTVPNTSTMPSENDNETPTEVVEVSNYIIR